MKRAAARSITRMILETASGWRSPSALKRGSPRNWGRRFAIGRSTRSVVATPFDTTVKTSHLFLSSNFQDCHTAPGIQKCEKNSRSTYQLFTKETCEAELRGPVFGNVVGAWCKPLHTAQKTCKVCCWFLKSFQFQSEPLPLICKFTSDCAAQCPLHR